MAIPKREMTTAIEAAAPLETLLARCRQEEAAELFMQRRGWDGLRCWFQVVTPDLARWLLKRNERNRNLNQAHMMRLAEELKSDQFIFNGATVVFFANGDVADSQHRLFAIIESNKPMLCLFVFGIPDEAMATIDSNQMVRGGACVVEISGERKRSRLLAAVVKWVLRWERGGLGIARTRCPLTNRDVLDGWARHAAIAGAIDVAYPVVRKLFVPAGGVAAFYIIRSRNVAVADRMLRTLEDPSDVRLDDPFLQLRQNLMNMKSKRRDADIEIAWAIKAANLVHAGRTASSLRWIKGHDRFPALDF